MDSNVFLRVVVHRKPTGKKVVYEGVDPSGGGGGDCRARYCSSIDSDGSGGHSKGSYTAVLVAVAGVAAAGVAAVIALAAAVVQWRH